MPDGRRSAKGKFSNSGFARVLTKLLKAKAECGEWRCFPVEQSLASIRKAIESSLSNRGGGLLNQGVADITTIMQPAQDIPFLRESRRLMATPVIDSFLIDAASTAGSFPPTKYGPASFCLGGEEGEVSAAYLIKIVTEHRHFMSMRFGVRAQH